MFFDVTLHGHCAGRHQLTNVAIRDMISLLIQLATRQAGGQLLRAACYDHFPSVPVILRQGQYSCVSQTDLTQRSRHTFT
jgi:hypothetical protein